MYKIKRRCVQNNVWNHEEDKIIKEKASNSNKIPMIYTISIIFCLFCIMVSFTKFPLKELT